MSRVNNPRIALTNIPFNTTQYKEHLERVLEQLYTRSGGGESGIDLTNSELNALAQTLNGIQPQIDTLSNDQDSSELAITQLQNDLITANSTISTLQSSITNLELTNAQQDLDIADLLLRVTALENA